MQIKFFDNQPLARKLILAIAVKLLGLLVIWWVFFSAPGDRELTPEQVGSAILHPMTRNTTTP
jgi:hypothetical protein